jgi:hypothetical protein
MMTRSYKGNGVIKMIFTTVDQRIWDKRYDGHRFCFHSKYGITTLKDELGEFEDVELPNDVAELLARMLGDLHELQMDKKSTFGNLKSLIQIASESELDNEVLITCIKYGMEYNKE